MRVIGIDPGAVVTGWSIVDFDECSGNIVIVDCGDIVSNKNCKSSNRLFNIHNEIIKIINLYNPSSAAIEIVFVNNNPKTSMILESARGAILLTFAIVGIDVFEYNACSVKKVVFGHGHAKKFQIKYIINSIFSTNKDIDVLSDDACDAIAIALCHIYSNK